MAETKPAATAVLRRHGIGGAHGSVTDPCHYPTVARVSVRGAGAVGGSSDAGSDDSVAVQ